MTIGANIRRLRQELGLGATDLARLSKTPLRTLQEVEKDSTDPRASTLKRIIIALGGTADQILFDDDELGKDGDLQVLFRELARFEGPERDVAKEVIKALIVQQKSRELNR